MLESVKGLLTARSAQRLLVLGIVVAGLGIAASEYLRNGPETGDKSCPAQPKVAAAIDKAATGELAALKPTATGRSYADLSFVDDSGKPKTLKDFAGTPLLVNFWATWCVPCREEMPELSGLIASYRPDTFAVVPINLDLGDDGVNKAHAFLDDEGLKNVPVYADPTYTAFDRLKKNGVALGLPATLLLDQHGCEMAVLQGPAAWNSKDGHKVIDALIKATGAEAPAD